MRPGPDVLAVGAAAVTCFPVGGDDFLYVEMHCKWIS